MTWLQWTIGALVFYKAEYGQGWSYFESFYFAYTTLLTIGYGDFQPESNSGKPFFVFWSLLAVPTLTILISNMGDTVVKAIKDLTIWLGEISVLPSEEGGVLSRLKYGVYTATRGKIDMEKGQQIETGDKEVDEDWHNFQETNPGLIRMPNQQKDSRMHSKKLMHQGNELATAFEQSEKQEEAAANKRGDPIAAGKLPSSTPFSDRC